MGVLYSIFHYKYYRFGFLHYWYGHNKRKVGAVSVMPPLLLGVICAVVNGEWSFIGLLVLFMMDYVMLIILVVYYFFIPSTLPFIDDWIERMATYFFIEMVIVFVVGRFMMNRMAERYFGVDLSSKEAFYHSPKDIFT
jgi:hypothetical protein